MLSHQIRVPFQWTKHQQQAFNTLQHALSSSETLAFYNSNADTRLTVDASPQGLGTILSQCQLDGSYRPLSYGSRSLIDIATRYSQTEHEALAVFWVCKRFHYYVYDRNFRIQTDHKSLERMLSPTSNPPPPIQRWLVHLQPYNYIIQYIPRNLNHEDYLSRKVASVDNLGNNLQCSEQYISMIASDGTTKSVSLDDLKHHTNKDPLLESVITSIKSNRWIKKKRFLQSSK